MFKEVQFEITEEMKAAAQANIYLGAKEELKGALEDFVIDYKNSSTNPLRIAVERDMTGEILNVPSKTEGGMWRFNITLTPDDVFFDSTYEFKSDPDSSPTDGRSGRCDIDTLIDEMAQVSGCETDDDIKGIADSINSRIQAIAIEAYKELKGMSDNIHISLENGRNAGKDPIDIGPSSDMRDMLNHALYSKMRNSLLKALEDLQNSKIYSNIFRAYIDDSFRKFPIFESSAAHGYSYGFIFNPDKISFYVGKRLEDGTMAVNKAFDLTEEDADRFFEDHYPNGELTPYDVEQAVTTVNEWLRQVIEHITEEEL